MTARERLHAAVDALPAELLAGAERLLTEPGFRPLLQRLGETSPHRASDAPSQPAPAPAQETGDEYGIPFTMRDEVLFDFYFRDGGR